MAERGEDSEHLHEAYIRHLNEALAGRPEGMTVTTHMCRGNFRDSWVAEGGYDFVAEALFNELTVDGFFMEYDDERSGTFEPLRHVPKDKLVVLGLVTTKHGELESKDALKAPPRRRLEVHRPRPGLHLPAVRLLLDVRGQLALGRPGEGQARAARRAGRRGLGLNRLRMGGRAGAARPPGRPRRSAGRRGSTASSCRAPGAPGAAGPAPSGPRRRPRTSRPCASAGGPPGPGSRCAAHRDAVGSAPRPRPGATGRASASSAASLLWTASSSPSPSSRCRCSDRAAPTSAHTELQDRAASKTEPYSRALRCASPSSSRLATCRYSWTRRSPSGTALCTSGSSTASTAFRCLLATVRNVSICS